MHLPSIVVQSLLRDNAECQFEKWVETVFEALNHATSAHIIASWRVLVGGSTTELDDHSIGRFQLRAQAAGGELSFVVVDSELGRRAGHGELFDNGTEDLVLVLESRVVILKSTIARMLESLAPGVASVNARVLPIDRAERPDEAIVATSQGDTSCVLLSRAMLEATGGIGSHTNGTTPRKIAASTYCPEAVAFSDRRISRPGSLDEAGASMTEGSLLEHALSGAGAERSKDLVAQALTRDREPFLSVVMRTQAHRPEALRDSLLCMAGQGDSRFELLLVVHDGNSESVRGVLDDQPEWLRARTKVVAATGGTRSRPINVGIGEATGSLVAFLDDDDLVFAHWVSSFLAAAESYPRRLIRTEVAVQRVADATWQGGVQGHISESELDTPYPSIYNLADHMRVNMTPFMAFAFPRKFLELCGGADETLEVCEDWDLSLRAASVLGVVDYHALTAIYRRWNSGGDSYSRHDMTAWKRDMLRVRQKLDSKSLLLPPGSASELAHLSATREVASELSAVYNSSSWRLTAPLRAVMTQLGRLVQGFRAAFRGTGS